MELFCVFCLRKLKLYSVIFRWRTDVFAPKTTGGIGLSVGFTQEKAAMHIQVHLQWVHIIIKQ